MFRRHALATSCAAGIMLFAAGVGVAGEKSDHTTASDTLQSTTQTSGTGSTTTSATETSTSAAQQATVSTVIQASHYSGSVTTTAGDSHGGDSTTTTTTTTRTTTTAPTTTGDHHPPPPPLSTTTTTTATTPQTTPTPAPGPVSGSLFVSPAGSDKNGCSSSAPCLSFDRAYHVAQPGQTVLMAAGVYGPQSISADSSKLAAPGDVVFRPAGGTVTLPNSVLTVSGSHVELHGISMDQTGCTNTQIAPPCPTVAVASGAHDVLLDGIHASRFFITGAYRGDGAELRFRAFL